MGFGKFPQILTLISVIVGVQLLTLFTGTGHYLTQLTMTAYYSIVIIGLCALMGYAGQISLGHAGFFAIGGYTSALLTTHNLSQFSNLYIVKLLSDTGILESRQDLYSGQLLNFHPWAAFIFAIIFTIAIAYLIGGPVLKLKGHYLAMATLGFGIIVYRVALGSGILGAADGISEVPGFRLAGGIEVSGKLSMRVMNYYIAWSLVILGIIMLLNLVNSRVGRALRSIHGSEDAANAMGVNTARYKLNIFVLSAAFAAIAGVFLTHYNGGIGPSESSVMKSVRYVAIVAIGGMANLWGALTMGFLLNFLSLRGYFGSYDDAVFGVILIVIMLFTPEGLLRAELFSSVKKILFRKKDTEESVQ